MVELVYLSPGNEMPESPDDELWLIVEASGDGRFFGTGYGRKSSGEGVFYVSLPESASTLDSALAAAKKSWLANAA